MITLRMNIPSDKLIKMWTKVQNYEMAKCGKNWIIYHLAIIVIFFILLKSNYAQLNRKPAKFTIFAVISCMVCWCYVCHCFVGQFLSSRYFVRVFSPIFTSNTNMISKIKIDNNLIPFKINSYLSCSSVVQI